MAAEDRLRWRCRRGARELDLMLGRYLERGWPRAGAAERAAFECLLDLPDPELHALLTGTAVPGEPELARLLARMRAVCPVVPKVELPEPDGRPLHGYLCTRETFNQLEEALKQSLKASSSLDGMDREFVFWATEHIRLRFSGGKLTWDFVFDGLGLPGGHTLGKRLVEQGLREWKRSVVKLETGRKMYLYSLMYEGGVPETLLREDEGLYRKSVMGLITEIEREGGVGATPYVLQMAKRWINYLPQTFHDEDFALLLAELAKTLVYWRGKLPKDLPKGVAQHWLDTNCRDWSARLPLRMTPQIAKTLILPALEAERSDFSLALEPILSRELRRQNDTGRWLGYLVFSDVARLPAQIFPNRQESKLRLLPTGARDVHVGYQAIPEDGGWHLRCLSGTKTPFRFPPHEEFAFTAYADNRFVGEVIVDSGQPSPQESLSFWRAAESSEGADADRLIPLGSRPRTRAQQIWLLGAQDIDLMGDRSLNISEPENAPDGKLWRISGRGYLHVGNERYLIETGADEESREARMFLIGKILPDWRRGGSVPVYSGIQQVYGVYDSGQPNVLPSDQIHYIPGRLLCSKIAEWVKESEKLARIQYICLPAGVNFQLRESGPGQVLFHADGLKSGWVVTLQAADKWVSSSVENGRVSLQLSVAGAVPGLVKLKLYDPLDGKALDLQAIWPAKRAVLLDPEGQRLEQNKPISIDAMNGWRAVVPKGALGGDLQMQLAHRLISLPVEGEVSLATNSQLIRAMLAQGDMDAQVNVTLHVGGVGSKRLEIRRYQDRAAIIGDTLQVRLNRDGPEIPVSELSDQLRTGCLWLYAVDISAPERAEIQENIVTHDLRALLGNAGGPWLIQSRFDGRVQRPVVWRSEPSSLQTRDALIQTYAREWREMLDDVRNQKWDMWWKLMESVGKEGDIGALYQVQALARVPAAAIALALRVPRNAVPVVMNLDSAVPIFWPTLPVAEFISAIETERAWQKVRWSESLKGFSDEEIENFGDEVVIKHIHRILTQRPELAAHFGRAMIKTDIFHNAMQFPECQEALSLCLRPKSEIHARLRQLAQQTVRRNDRLPAGVHCPSPLDSPFGNSFPWQIQPLVNAPFVAAEMAIGLHPPPDIDVKLALINLRNVDSAYFDDALPAALQFLTTEDS